MREISAQTITETVRRLCIEANCHLSSDLKTRIEEFYGKEPWPQAKEILGRIIENYQIADAQQVPVLRSLRYHNQQYKKRGTGCGTALCVF